MSCSLYHSLFFYSLFHSTWYLILFSQIPILLVDAGFVRLWIFHAHPFYFIGLFLEFLCNTCLLHVRLSIDICKLYKYSSGTCIWIFEVMKYYMHPWNWNSLPNWTTEQALCTYNTMFHLLHCVYLCFFFLFFFITSVVETKDGTVSVAAAFAGHQEGNASALFWFLAAMFSY